MTVSAVLRLFGLPDPASIVRRFIELDALDHVAVLVDSRRDAAQTPVQLESMVGTGRLSVRPLNDYGWAKALNAGIAYLANNRESLTAVLCASADAVPSAASLDAMISDLAARDASCAFPDYRRPELPYQIPRNTCALWRYDALAALGGFDQSLDAKHGMEDYDFALKAWTRLGKYPVKTPTVVDLSHRRGPEFARKTAAERSAMREISSRYDARAASALHRMVGATAHL